MRSANSTSGGSGRSARYYIAAGVGGLAVGVHTTQFAIRDPQVGLFRPVLELAGRRWIAPRSRSCASAASAA
jgi:hypothetical protein